MNKLYFYGNSEDENFCITDMEEAAQDIWEQIFEDEYLVMVEMVVSRKSGERWCKKHNEFTEGADPCGKECCNSYEPRNGKKGICKFLSWGLIETGREWKVFPDGTYRKISGRKK